MPLPSETPPARPPAKLVLWIIWAALLGGVVITRFMLVPSSGANRPAYLDNDVLQTLMLLGPALVSFAVRLLWVPRAPDRGRVLVACIVGIAIAESLTHFGLFLFPARLDLFFGVSVTLIATYCPLFVPERPAATPAKG